MKLGNSYNKMKIFDNEMISQLQCNQWKTIMYECKIVFLLLIHLLKNLCVYMPQWLPKNPKNPTIAKVSVYKIWFQFDEVNTILFTWEQMIDLQLARLKITVHLGRKGSWS